MTFDDVAPAFHTGAVASILGSLVGWLPPLAAVLAAIWYSIEIYESKTFQRIIVDRRARRVIRMRARILELEQLTVSTPAPPHPPEKPSP